MKVEKRLSNYFLSDHDKKCLSCVRSGNCELQTLSTELGCDASNFEGEKNEYPLDESTPYLVRDNNKCIMCRRCVAACKEYQSIAVIGANARGFRTHVGSEFSKPLMEVACVGCGQCINVCPTGALRERDEIDEVYAAINDPSKVVIVGTAPSVRVGLGEEFGNPIGTNVEGKMVAALKKLGFDWVFDVNVTADLTILEEGTEFIGRVLNGGKLPMITSCSPGWIKYIEHYYPDYLAHLSSCKSPQQMFGAVCKTYFAEKMGLDPKNIVVVSIMPCTAKKFEKTRPYQNAAGEGIQDIDYSLTSRELARFIKRQGIMFNELKDETFDAPMGIGIRRRLNLGATGGVMEAALRTVYEVLEEKELKNLDFKAVRGTKGIKEAVIPVHVKGNLVNVKVAAVSGLANAKVIMEKIKKGEADYHFIEVMACPGGCVNGGGQPIQPADVRNNVEVIKVRASMLYKTDKNMKLRKSHESPVVKELYDTYFVKPGSEKAHHILHTKYVARGK